MIAELHDLQKENLKLKFQSFNLLKFMIYIKFLKFLFIKIQLIILFIFLSI